MALLSLPGSSGAAERNWSAHGFIQSPLRTCLDPVRLRKLVYIYFNLKALASKAEKPPEEPPAPAPAPVPEAAGPSSSAAPAAQA